jgi:hypothetical protein
MTHTSGPPPPAEPFARGIDASEMVAETRWTMFERWQVDRAIEKVASMRERFTTDAVWHVLGPDFPVTKGMTGRLMAAKGQGMIVPTGEVVFSQRTGEHGHGQRLSVWRSLVAHAKD